MVKSCVISWASWLTLFSFVAEAGLAAPIVSGPEPTSGEIRNAQVAKDTVAQYGRFKTYSELINAIAPSAASPEDLEFLKNKMQPLMQQKPLQASDHGALIRLEDSKGETTEIRFVDIASGKVEINHETLQLAKGEFRANWKKIEATLPRTTGSNWLNLVIPEAHALSLNAGGVAAIGVAAIGAFSMLVGLGATVSERNELAAATKNCKKVSQDPLLKTAPRTPEAEAKVRELLWSVRSTRNALNFREVNEEKRNEFKKCYEAFERNANRILPGAVITEPNGVNSGNGANSAN
jgi:hypothetical protein